MAERDTDRVHTTPRRTVLAAGAVGAGAVAALAGCAEYGGQPDPPPPPPPPPGGDSDDDGSGDGSGDGADDGGTGTPVASAADVPVGGGIIQPDLGVVVTQPADGEFRGFSATCTHQGCAVTEVADGAIICPCHGSRFSIEDGSVVQAAQGLSADQQDPLPPVDIDSDGDTITLP